MLHELWIIDEWCWKDCERGDGKLGQVTLLGLAAPSHDRQETGSDVSEWRCDLVHRVTVPLTFVLDTLCQASRVGALFDPCVLFADRPQSKQSHSLPVIQRAPFVPSIRSA